MKSKHLFSGKLNETLADDSLNDKTSYSLLQDRVRWM